MKRRGLTLIEILIAISVITLLMAIFFPIARRSREEARAVLCGSNIRQLLLGLFAYEGQNGRLPYSFCDSTKQPPPGGWAGSWAYDRRGWWWLNYISGYSKATGGRAEPVFCPAKNVQGVSLENNVLCGNYGINPSVCKYNSGQPKMAEFIGMPLSSADIPHSGRTVLIADAGYAIIGWIHAVEEPPFALGSNIEDSSYIPGLSINRKRTNLWTEQKYDAFSGRHPGKTVNVGFADGHVSREKAENLLVEKTSDGYKNCSPLWRPK